MNRLARATSLYLRQHATNPIDWWTWGPEPFAQARRLGRPLFLSIGYSSCHWCHVMAHESFEDSRIAQMLNDMFVCVKVDREERPDVDRLYMDTVVAMTGRGGWPMSVFLAPDAVPIFAGTYFPPEDRYGIPGFVTVLQSVDRVFRESPDKVAQNRERFFAALGRPRHIEDSTVTEQAMVRAEADWGALKLTLYDSVYGGYGDAPKFPPSCSFESLYRCGRTHTPLLASIRHTVRAICDGGMRDQVGGGFHRYSTDERWLVPHFEKMLYDQSAMLEALGYESLEADGEWAVDEAVQIRSFLQRDMAAGSCFASALDADDAGGEGYFYSYSERDLAAVGAAERFAVPGQPNFHHGRYLLARDLGRDRQQWYRDPEVGRIQSALLQLQAQRSRPVCDTKILVEWNGHLAVQCYRWYQRSGDDAWLAMAEGIHMQLLAACQQLPDGQWRVPHVVGDMSDVEFLEDYAAVAASLVARASSIDPGDFRVAQSLLRAAIARFSTGAVLYASTPDPLLPLRRAAPMYDAPTPPAAVVLWRLCNVVGVLLDDRQLTEHAYAGVADMWAVLQKNPAAAAKALESLREIVRGPEILLVLRAAGARGAAGARALRAGVWTVQVRAQDYAQTAYTRGLQASAADRYLYCRDRSCGLPSAVPFG